MKNKSVSLIISLIMTAVFTAALAVLTFGALWLLQLMCDYFERWDLYKLVLIMTYLGVPAGWGALWCLFKMLTNIGWGFLFEKQNVKILNILSWLCIYVGLLCAVGTFGYIVFIIISLSAMFMGLIIRVIKNIVEKAIEIKEGNDMTV